MKVGDRVRHKSRGFQGEVIATVGMPHLPGIDKRVIVRIQRPGVGGGWVEHRCWASDLVVQPIAIDCGRAGTLPASGAVHDALADAVVARLAEERPGRPSSVPGLNVVDGDRR